VIPDLGNADQGVLRRFGRAEQRRVIAVQQNHRVARQCSLHCALNGQANGMIVGRFCNVNA